MPACAKHEGVTLAVNETGVLRGVDQKGPLDAGNVRGRPGVPVLAPPELDVWQCCQAH